MAKDAWWYAGYLRIAEAESAPAKMVFLEAADLIEALCAELEQVKQERDGLSILLTSAESAFETVKRERDAAVNELATHKFCHMCKYCEVDMHDNFRCVTCRGKSNWEWRGPCEENGGATGEQ